MVNPLTIRDVAEIIPDEWEERANVYVRIGYIAKHSQDVGQVEKVPVDVGRGKFEMSADENTFSR
ncbi:MAG: hypothetical protein OXG62_07010 [Nitrospinae bacterium]|nr:hypothetical protein [Nitrospinota bacterium]